MQNGSRASTASTQRRHLLGDFVDMLHLRAREETRAGRATPATIAENLGVGVRSVQDAVYGNTWSHLPGAVQPPPQASWLEGEGSPLAKLTEDEVREIRRLRAKRGHTYAGLAEQFGVSVSTIAAICQGRVWKHLL